jgi:hypothetical protein
MGEFLIVRQDKESGELIATYTLHETLDRLVPAYYIDREPLEQSFRDDQLVQTTVSNYFALNGQHDPRKRN